MPDSIPPNSSSKDSQGSVDNLPKCPPLNRQELPQTAEAPVSAESNDVSDIKRTDSTATPNGPPDQALPDGRRIVIGRRQQHRLNISLALGSIDQVAARAYVLGLFRDVAPAGAAKVLDSLLDGVISELIARRMFSGNMGEISIIPTGRHPVQADLIAFAGLGAFDQFGPDVIELLAENMMRTFLKTRVDDFATVLFGGGSGQAPTAILECLLKGFFRGLIDTDGRQRFHGITICETSRDRYDSIKQHLYRLAGTPLFDPIEVTIDEIELPPVVQQVRGREEQALVRREPVYLIVRCDQAQESILRLDASLLTSGTKATVIAAAKEVKTKSLFGHLEKIKDKTFTFAALKQFGAKLAKLVLPSDLLAVLNAFSQNELVVVNDAGSSVIPWETIYFNNRFPAATAGLSRRYLADNLAVAKWLERRKKNPILDILLVVNPTADLPGAEEEGRRIETLFGDYATAIRVTRLEKSGAGKNVLLRHMASGRYDVLHYAGHAYFNPQNPERSGILCAGREVLSGADLAGVGNLPALMFFNACEAGRIRAGSETADRNLTVRNRMQHNVGLAEAFLRGGVANYVGTYWPVGDEAAKSFADMFYRQLLQGDSIGKALLDGRRKLCQDGLRDWADYLFYGSSDFTLKIPGASGSS